MKDGVWQKVTPARQVDYPAIQYSLSSGMDNELSYDLTTPYNLIAGTIPLADGVPVRGRHGVFRADGKLGRV